MRIKCAQLCACVLALSLVWASAALATSGGKNPLEQLTGSIWMQSSMDVKEAFLFGVECTIAIEQYAEEEIAKEAKKQGKKPTFTVSPFDKAWKQATKDMSRTDIVKQIDAWYAGNPTKHDRLVFDVIWEEIIAPKIAKR